MKFQDLPTELILHIVSFLAWESELNALARVNHHLQEIADPLLYRRNAHHPTHTPLGWAARNGMEVTARKSLAAGCNPHRASAYGRPLAQAALNGHVNIIRLLCECGVDPSEEKERLDPRNGTWEGLSLCPLAAAAKARHEDVVKVLLEYGVSPNGTLVNTQGKSPLCEAASGGDLDIVQLLVDSGADIEAGKQPPLLLAAENGHTEVVRFLLERGANPDAKDLEMDQTPVLRAVLGGHGETLQCLLDHGAHLQLEGDSPVHPLDYMPLMESPGALDVVFRQKEFLEAAKLKSQKATVLGVAAGCGKVDVVKSALAKGWDPNWAIPCFLFSFFHERLTPLHWAVEWGHAEVVNLLLEHGASVSGQEPDPDFNEHGHMSQVEAQYPLQIAVARGHEPIVSLLLAHGSDPNIREREQDSVLVTALPFEGIFRMLLEQGADPKTALSRSGEELHIRALYVGTPGIIRILLESGIRFEETLPRLRHGKPRTLVQVVSLRDESVWDMFVEQGYEFRPGGSNDYEAVQNAVKLGNCGVLRRLAHQGFSIHSPSPSAVALPAVATLTVTYQQSAEKSEAMLDLLLGLGMSIEEEDASGRTGLLWAALRENARAVDLLLDRGANPVFESHDNRTPLSEACKNGCKPVVDLLLRAMERHRGPLDTIHRHVNEARRLVAGTHGDIVKMLDTFYWRTVYPP